MFALALMVQRDLHRVAVPPPAPDPPPDPLARRRCEEQTMGVTLVAVETAAGSVLLTFGDPSHGYYIGDDRFHAVGGPSHGY
jgi:hypothetical protein